MGIVRAVLSMAFVAAVAPLASCHESDPVAVFGEDRELVGLWMGSMRGPIGESAMTLHLHADSTMMADNENTKYPRIEGVWTVSDSSFRATASTEYGALVTLVARAPFVRLTGTWTSNGSGGTFDLAKR